MRKMERREDTGSGEQRRGEEKDESSEARRIGETSPCDADGCEGRDGRADRRPARVSTVLLVHDSDSKRGFG